MALNTESNQAQVIPEIWAREIGLAATSRRIIAPKVEKVDFTGPGDQMHFEQVSDIAATKPATGGFGSLTSSTIGFESEVTVTPAIAVAYVQIEHPVLNRWLSKMSPAVQKRLGISLGNQVESDLAALHSDAIFTAGTDQDGFDMAGMVAAIGGIWSNGGDLVNQGVDPVFAIYHPDLWDNFINDGINQQSGAGFLSASMRGEANGPAKTGRIIVAFGAEVDFTGHIVTAEGAAGTYANNMIFAEGALVMAEKELPNVKDQEFELTLKIIAYQDYGVATLWDEILTRHQCLTA